MSIPEFTILPLRPTDRAGVRLLLEQAFESPLEAQFVDQVARQHMSICEFVAVNGDHVLGHILFTPLDVRSPERAISSLALAPVSVVGSRSGWLRTVGAWWAWSWFLSWPRMPRRGWTSRVVAAASWSGTQRIGPCSPMRAQRRGRWRLSVAG